MFHSLEIISVMAYQLFMGYSMPKCDSFVNGSIKL